MAWHSAAAGWRKLAGNRRWRRSGIAENRKSTAYGGGWRSFSIWLACQRKAAKINGVINSISDGGSINEIIEGVASVWRIENGSKYHPRNVSKKSESVIIGEWRLCIERNNEIGG